METYRTVPVPSTWYLLSLIYYLLPATTYSTTYYLLPATGFLLLYLIGTAYYLLPTTYYLYTTYYLLPTTYSTTYYLLRNDSYVRSIIRPAILPLPGLPPPSPPLPSPPLPCYLRYLLVLYLLPSTVPSSICLEGSTRRGRYHDREANFSNGIRIIRTLFQISSFECDGKIKDNSCTFCDLCFSGLGETRSAIQIQVSGGSTVQYS